MPEIKYEIVEEKGGLSQTEKGWGKGLRLESGKIESQNREGENNYA